MVEEESLQVSKRTTRSSTPAAAWLPTMPSNQQKPLSWEVHADSRDFAPLGSFELPSVPYLYLWRRFYTGKTSIILQLFKHLNRPFVCSSCITCYNARILFETVLNQLLLHKKSAGNGYSSANCCDKPYDFVNFLRKALVNVIESLKGNSGKLKLNSSECHGRPNGSMVYLVFDNLELDRGSYHANMGYIEPVPAYFPDYIEDNLCQFFMKSPANPKLYSSFLDIVLKPFCRVTKQVDELSTAFSSLFEKYYEPLSYTGVVPDEGMRRRLFGHFQPHIAPSLNETLRVQSQPSFKDESNKKTMRKCSTESSGSQEGFDKTDFHMSTSAKYLLISAFLASRNPATLDSIFDSTGGSNNRKRKRKASVKSMEQEEIAEQESLIKGPGTFPLESLYNAHFTIKGGSCPLEGSTMHRPTVSEDLAQKVAWSLQFPLSNYWYRR
ncbi:hypothetical protein SLA2020_511820 [Shorea laevis]